MSTQEQFDAAVAWLSSSSQASGLGNDKRLELYGLFKFANSSSGPTGSRPGIFSFEGRAKYDAWARVAAEYDGRLDAARARYVEIARSAGWAEGAEAVDEGEEGAERKSSGGGGGFGPSVSMMVPTDEGGSQSLVHDAAATGSTETLRQILAADRALLDAKDEFGFTPLHLAADRGNVDAVKLLISLGADKSILDPDEQTALDIATISGRDDVVALLS
ncbi:hypothetical protein Q8F55_007760 [Vanrija albida]|uniref:ACB domain-containing protein n=1 Tax=Vanrija albida TaxID=181172 RepID=A0ABR3PUF2_9TREE